ncbi:MAG: WD40/YVTN/BNR-like repeat-containing protein, partial [Candidatus Kapaibacteriota bacterium]
MKSSLKSLIILILSLANLSIGFSFEQNEFTENLDLNRISVNFNGSVSNGTSILVYGDGGTILRSIDGGTTWKKIVLADTLNIVGMISRGFLYLGLTSHRWGILSMDNGNTWNFVDIGNYNFYQLLPYNNNIIALTENKVLIFNTSFNIIQEYPYNTDANYYKATISGNDIYCSSGYGKITKINLENGNTNVLSLSDFGVCSDCPIVTDLVADSKGNVFFSLNNYLFKFDTGRLKIDT